MDKILFWSKENMPRKICGWCRHYNPNDVLDIEEPQEVFSGSGVCDCPMPKWHRQNVSYGPSRVVAYKDFAVSCPAFEWASLSSQQKLKAKRTKQK